MNTYIIKRKKGIDDLQNIYAWTGNSQGDESFTNDIGEGLASNGWMSYRFKDIDILDQEAINKESIRRQKANEEYIKKLKEEGYYGEEFDVVFHIQPNPIFDAPNLQTKPSLNDYKLIFLDNLDNLPK